MTGGGAGGQAVPPELGGAVSRMGAAQAMMLLSPGWLQNMPERLQREPMSVLQPASMTPEPMNMHCLRKLPCIILGMLRTK